MQGGPDEAINCQQSIRQCTRCNNKRIHINSMQVHAKSGALTTATEHIGSMFCHVTSPPPPLSRPSVSFETRISHFIG
jgi:hypothetical protein